MSGRDLFGDAPPAADSPHLFAALPEGGLLGLAMMTTLRSVQEQQNGAMLQLSKLQSGLHSIDVRLTGLDVLRREVDDLKRQVAAMAEEKHQRRGMILLMEWCSKHLPWLFAAAAAVWALRTTR